MHCILRVSYLRFFPQALKRLTALKNWNAYRELPSVEDYVLVSSERQAVEVHHRDRKQNYWITRIYSSGDTVRIESLDAEFLYG